MINKLPSEIILKSSRYLRLKDKLELAKTCSRLYNLISKIALFEELDLMEFRTESQRQIIKMFQDNMYDNSQRLVLDLESDVQYANRRFGEYFNRYSEYQYSYNVDEVYSLYKQGFNSGLDVYRISGFKFFSKFSKSLQTLKMNVQLFNGVIEAMSDSNMNLIELDFHDVIPSTDIYGEVPYRYVLDDADQLQFIHKLALLRTLKISVKSFNSLVWRYQQCFLSTSITQLSIECKYRTLYIGWVLDMFPSLERLLIDYSKCNTKDDAESDSDDIFSDTREKQDQNIHLNLQTLIISHCSIYPQVLGFLKTAVPNITHLSLHTVNIIPYSHGGVYDIDLSSCNLKMFKISRVTYKSPHTLKGNHHFAIQTDSKDLIYATSGEDISLTRGNEAFKKLESVSKIKSIEDDMESLMIF